MELFWTQEVVVNFYTYVNIYNTAFIGATAGISYLLGEVYGDFPLQQPVVSDVAFFNNFGAALAIVGGGIGLFGGENPAVAFGGGMLGVLGGIFSDVGANLDAGTPSNTLTDLEQRLNVIYSQVTNSSGQLITAVMERGDLSAYPSKIYAGSQYNNSLVAFFDNGNFLVFPDGFTVQALMPLISAQLLSTIVGTAVLEANYYILKDAYAVVDCPTGSGLTGAVINNSCFTLEEPGQGAGQTPQSQQSTFSNQMASDTVGRLVDHYGIMLSDLYTSSYSCQNASNAYSVPLDFSTFDFAATGIPPCFYNLPVFQVAPATDLSVNQATPCAMLEANSTAATPEAGLTFLPDNLSPIFTRDFCTFDSSVPIGHQVGQVAGPIGVLMA